MKPVLLLQLGGLGEMLAWGRGLIDLDQMSVPTRCSAATEIAPCRLAAFLKNTLCSSEAETSV